MSAAVAFFGECSCGHFSEDHRWTAWGGHGSCSRCECLAFKVPWPEQAARAACCGSYGGTHQPRRPNAFCDCSCHGATR